MLKEDKFFYPVASGKLLFLLVFLVVCSLPAQAWEFPTLDFSDDPPETPEAPPALRPNSPPPREKAPQPPDIRPYEIPRFSGRGRSADRGDADTDFHYIPPVKLSKLLDADAIYRMAINCFPERPQWGLELKAVAGARLTDDNRVSTFDTAGLARYYAGIVAEMPIYSADELHRVRQEETRRRAEAATHVAALLKALADRDRALRMIGIGESVEAREQFRISQDVGTAETQIGYLKEVAGAYGDLAAANAAIVAARLALAGQCRDEVYDQVNHYLVEVTR